MPHVPMPINIRPGTATAHPYNVRYRLERVAKYITGGAWLDYGCAEGGYTEGLLSTGAEMACGVDAVSDRIQLAREAHPDLPFYTADGALPFPEASFDGIFMNEVLEHVKDEVLVLSEVYRVMRPGGYLILMSPNRCFPFEGHAVTIGHWELGPCPFIPWLPKRLTNRWVTARNYWPKELRRKISSSGLRIVETGFILPVFEAYPWIPGAVAELYRKHITGIDRLIGIRRLLGVSNLVVAQRPESAGRGSRAERDSELQAG